jgi:M6 family metalloprotease-like protein
MHNFFHLNGRQRLVMLVALLMLAVVTFAVPAKPGLTRLLTLADGSLISGTLVGDEHGHYWLGNDGNAYQTVGDDTYQRIDPQVAQTRGSQRRAQANQRRMKRLAPRKIGNVGSITGQKKGLIILVNFSDVTFKSANNNALYQRIANEVNFNDGDFKGSMYEYFYDQSDGQFELTFEVVGPVTVSKEQSYYGQNNSYGEDMHAAEMVIEAIKLADAQVNFADYDWDGDKEVEQVYVVYAGKGEADGGAANTIWPHEYDLDSANRYGDGAGPQTLDGVKINTYACGGELNGSGNIAGIGTMCHEFSHCLGYPDFYDTDYSGGQGMGSWDLMDGGSYNDDGYQPAGYTSYERWVAGWKTPVTLETTQTISNMAALQTKGSNAYIIYNKGNNNEYYLLENRHKTGWDASLPGEGLLILHVDYDETAWKNNKPNDNPNHQRMTWIPADNNYQYKMSNGAKYYTLAGMATDPFPYGSVNAFGKNTTPAAKLYNKNIDGTYYLDCSIQNITQNSDGTISFDFNGESNVIPADPAIVADESLAFNTTVGTPQTLQLEVMSEGLTEDITLTLTDANNVFSLGTTTISSSEEDAYIDVTFTPTAVGTYTGTITLTSEGADPVTVTLTATATDASAVTVETIDFTAQGYSNGDVVTSTSGINCTVAFDKGTNTNAPKYYDTGTAIRLYGGNTMTIASATKTIEKIELTFGSGDGSNEITTNVATYADGTWTGSASSVTFTIGGTSGHRRIKAVKVTYEGALDPAIAYYEKADGKQGAALKTAMCGIIYNRTEIDYDNLWTAYQTTDVRSDGKIWDMYSNVTSYDPVNDSHANSAEGSGFNREHSFPKSWFGGEIMPMFSDLHHLYPVDGNINTRRSNNPYGENNGELYTSANGFSKLGACTFPGYTGKVFEPADEYKGDFARTYFYMVTCYEEKLPDWFTNYSTTEVTAVLDGSTYPGLSEWQLKMLMKWAKNDPVSEKETNRNNAVYSIQKNRNPFIDYPGLEEYVWGSMTTTAFSYDSYVQPVYKQDVAMSFSTAEATATLYETFTEPTLTTTPADLTVTYNSSDETVATVNSSTGEVSLVAAGTTIITATFAGDGSYAEASASYTLTVLPATTPDPDPVVGSGKYELMTDASKLAAGDKILIAYVNGDSKYVLSTTQNANNRAATSITVNADGTLSPDEKAQVITLEKDGANFLFNVDDGYLYAASSTSNYLKTEKSADDNGNAEASISISDGEATIVFQGTNTHNTMRFNPNTSNSNPLFSCYAPTSTAGSLPQIYREVHASFIKGDANGDGKVTITDAVAIVNYILGNQSANFNAEAANVNGDVDDDGKPKITITDAVGVVNIILNGSGNQ